MSVTAAEPKASARVRILRAMMALDDHRSVQEHTVEEIARLAGVAKGSVYYHFSSKESLVREILVHGAAEMKELMDGLQGEGPTPEDAREAFRTQVAAAFRFLEDHSSFTGLVAFALAQREGDESHQLRAEKEAIVSLLADRIEHLERSRAAGESLTPRHTLEIAATALLSAAVTLSIERMTVHPDWSAEACVDALLRIATSGP
ncbi:TetR/AcrR family transcriptional regulator [Nesterenkonia populi]|uniref:TetR/AcrR family transcriptional regulator n=1 Tax=Nesterenkonia populi TaxID=1591087 RepID=UPI0011BF0408|nr:TetR/AcrR family transcriptional regulator [Nesterenkonia populi]